MYKIKTLFVKKNSGIRISDETISKEFGSNKGELAIDMAGICNVKFLIINDGGSTKGSSSPIFISQETIKVILPFLQSYAETGLLKSEKDLNKAKLSK